MAHTLTISIPIPTKEEVKEKISAFWTKHKKTILVLDGPVAHDTEDGYIIADVYIALNGSEVVIAREEPTPIVAND